MNADKGRHEEGGQMHGRANGRDRRTGSWTAALLLLALVGTACGARLEPTVRDAIVSAPRGGSVVAPGEGGPATSAPGSTSSGTDVDLADPTNGAGTTNGASSDQGTSGTSGTGTSSTSGSSTSAPNTPGTSTGSTDVRAAPPGGNGGATAVGVTADTITIANVADLSGAVQGLFEDVQLATKAAVARFQATKGTIYGRELRLLTYDSRMDSGGNRAAYLDVCAKAFAAVGSMSAFDMGVAPVVEDCGVPDLRTTALSLAIQDVDNVRPADAMKPYHQPIGEYRYLKSQFPTSVDKAAFLYITGEVTKYQSGMVRDATKTIGYEWDYVREIAVSESNYAPFVLDMKKAGIEVVAFQGAYQQAVNLANAMRQQNFTPKAYVLQANVYTPDFLATGRDAIEGVYVPIVSVMLEEIDQHPELQEYARWLDQVDPGSRPTGLGAYAWAATNLFIETVEELGPNLTREKFLDAIKQVKDWEGGGLIPPQDLGSKVPTDCNIILQVRGGRFVRVAPSKGFLCGDGAIKLQ